VCLLVLVLLVVQNLISTSNPYSEKVSPYECGFLAVGTAQQPFSIQFLLVGILFLIFDIEILLLYPVVSALYQNAVLAYWTFLIFIILLTIGFIYEFARGALYFTKSNPYLRGSPTTISLILMLILVIVYFLIYIYLSHDLAHGAPSWGGANN